MSVLRKVDWLLLGAILFGLFGLSELLIGVLDHSIAHKALGVGYLGWARAMDAKMDLRDSSASSTERAPDA